MIDFADEAFLGGVDLVRNLNRKAADRCAARGLSGDQIAIAALYSAFDIVERLTIGLPPTTPVESAERRAAGIAAIEWMRSGIDLMERQLMGAGKTHA